MDKHTIWKSGYGCWDLNYLSNIGRFYGVFDQKLISGNFLEGKNEPRKFVRFSVEFFNDFEG